MSHLNTQAAVNHHAPVMAGVVCSGAWVAAIASALGLGGFSGIVAGTAILVTIPALWMLSGVAGE